MIPNRTRRLRVSEIPDSRFAKSRTDWARLILALRSCVAGDDFGVFALGQDGFGRFSSHAVALQFDVLAYMAFPAQHRSKLHSTNPLERLNKEVKRRADVVGIFPSENSIIRLIGAVLFEQNDDWQSQHRYMMVEAFSQIDSLLSITTQAA